MLIQIQVVSKVMLICNRLGEVGVALLKWTWICHWIMLYCKICWLMSCTIRIRGPSFAQFHVHRWSTPIRLYFFTLKKSFIDEFCLWWWQRTFEKGLL